MRARNVLAAIGAIAAVAVTTAQGAERPAQTGPAQIRITDVQTSYALLKSRRGTHGAGSLELVKQSLYNPSVSGKPIGRSTLMCTYFDAHDRVCNATYFLPKGSLVVTGAIQSRLLYQIAVVGGTGLFDNARGTLTVTSTGLRPKRREVLLFRLAG
ncbi:MAG: hypothetical protein ACJ77E_14380 [Gaiellaceae bacterium]